MSAREFIVAIEFGSSKVTGIAGRKNMDGSITILQIVKEDANGCIRKGIVYNIDKTEQLLKKIIEKLRTSLRCEIRKVYVGVGGQSLRGIHNVIKKEFDVETTVTNEMIDELADMNLSVEYPEQEIVLPNTLEYKVDYVAQLDPVGIQCRKLEGHYLNIIWRKSFYRKLDQFLKNSGINLPEPIISPVVLAEHVLSESERRNGCMLVDLGAETTTVAIYYHNKLRHLSVLPLGSNNINIDLQSLQIDENEAEELKLRYGTAYTEDQDISDSDVYRIDDDRTIPVRTFNNIVVARMEEIIKNVIYQMPKEYETRLLGGVILTGGGSNMKNIVKAFQTLMEKDKVRVASSINQTVDSNHPEITAQDGTMNTILSLLANGEDNCAGPEIVDTPTIFAPTTEEELTENAAISPSGAGTSQRGKVVVHDRKEDLFGDEEKPTPQWTDDEEAGAKPGLPDDVKRKKKENKFINRIMTRIKKFAKDVMEEEKDTN